MDTTPPPYFPVWLLEFIAGDLIEPEIIPKMRADSDEWNAVGDQSLATNKDLSALQSKLESAGTGRTQDVIVKTVAQVAADTNDHAEFCFAMSEHLEITATDFEFNNLLVLGIGRILLIQLAADLAMFAVGAAKAAADRAAARAGLQLARVALLDRVGLTGARAMAVRAALGRPAVIGTLNAVAGTGLGAGMGYYVNRDAQQQQIDEGRRAAIDDKSLLESTVSGGVGGLFGAVAAFKVAPALGKITAATPKPAVRLVLHAGGTMAVGGMAGVVGGVTGLVATIPFTGWSAPRAQDWLTAVQTGFGGGFLGSAVTGLRAGLRADTHGVMPRSQLERLALEQRRPVDWGAVVRDRQFLLLGDYPGNVSSARFLSSPEQVAGLRAAGITHFGLQVPYHPAFSLREGLTRQNLADVPLGQGFKGEHAVQIRELMRVMTEHDIKIVPLGGENRGFGDAGIRRAAMVRDLETLLAYEPDSKVAILGNHKDLTNGVDPALRQREHTTANVELTGGMTTDPRVLNATVRQMGVDGELFMADLSEYHNAGGVLYQKQDAVIHLPQEATPEPPTVLSSPEPEPDLLGHTINRFVQDDLGNPEHRRFVLRTLRTMSGSDSGDQIKALLLTSAVADLMGRGNSGPVRFVAEAAHPSSEGTLRVDISTRQTPGARPLSELGTVLSLADKSTEQFRHGRRIVSFEIDLTKFAAREPVSAAAAEAYFAQRHVRTGLGAGNELDSYVPVGQDVLQSAAALRALVPNHPDLLQVMRRYPDIESTLLRQQMLTIHLMEHPEVIRVLAHAAEVPATNRIGTPEDPLPAPEPAPISDGDRAISERFSNLPEEHKRQPGFDLARKDDLQYRREFLDSLRHHWAADQFELNAAVRELVGNNGIEVQTRPEPKMLRRCFDKLVRVLDGDVGLLTDVVGVKVHAKSISGAYDLLQRLPEMGLEVVDFKDRFLSPMDSGYRDLKAVVRLPSGRLAEVQILQREVGAIDKVIRRLYEYRTSVLADAAHAGRAPTAWELALDRAVTRRERQLYDLAYRLGLGA